MPLVVSAAIVSLDDGTVLLTNAISAKELLKRWPGIAEFELAELMDENVIQGYSIIVPLQGNNGRTHYRCRIGGSCTRTAFDNYIWNDTCFNVEDVEKIEATRWYYKCNRPADEDHSPQDTSEWISCDTLANRWGWSPFDVVKFLNSGVIPFNNNWNHTPYVDGLHEFFVHQVDLLRWEAENADKINNAPVLAQDEARLRSENKELSAKAARLEAQNATLRSELEACSKGCVIPPKQPKTAPATEAASSRGVDRWKGFAAQMVKVAFDCATEGAKPRKRPQLQAIAKRHGDELSKTALEVLWAALPDKHKSTEPGPPRQD